jgi:hypothetical protein
MMRLLLVIVLFLTGCATTGSRTTCHWAMNEEPPRFFCEGTRGKYVCRTFAGPGSVWYGPVEALHSVLGGAPPCPGV